MKRRTELAPSCEDTVRWPSANQAAKLLGAKPASTLTLGLPSLPSVSNKRPRPNARSVLFCPISMKGAGESSRVIFKLKGDRFSFGNNRSSEKMNEK